MSTWEYPGVPLAADEAAQVEDFPMFAAHLASLGYAALWTVREYP